MRAILLAAGFNKDMAPLSDRYSSSMIPFFDRPFLQHVVEFLVAQGFTSLDFVLSYLPEKIEKFFRDGTRWGCEIHYHLARDPLEPYKTLKSMTFNSDGECVLLVHTDCLPSVQLTGFQHDSQEKHLVFVRHQSAGVRDHDDTIWTGWAVITSSFISEFPDDLNREGLTEMILAMPGSEADKVGVRSNLDIQTFSGYLDAHRAILNKEVTGLIFPGREVEEGVWLSRNVSLHPTVKITPPVYIGENCRIGQGLQLGPNVTLGNNCVLDGRCFAQDSVVLPGTYVGEALELKEVIIDRNWLINVPLNAVLSISEEFILGSLAKSQVLPWLRTLHSRLFAAMLLLPLFPVLGLTALLLKVFRKDPVFFLTEVICLPANAEDGLRRSYRRLSFCRPVNHNNMGYMGESVACRDFFLRFIPGLLNVVRGQLSFVGVPSRTSDEISQLPSDWRDLYLKSKGGIVTEGYVQFGVYPSEDEQFSSEVFYSASSNLNGDIKLLLRYFGKVIRSIVRFGRN